MIGTFPLTLTLSHGGERGFCGKSGEGVNAISSPLMGRDERIPSLSSPLMGEG